MINHRAHFLSFVEIFEKMLCRNRWNSARSDMVVLLKVTNVDNKFYQDAEVDCLNMGSGVKETQSVPGWYCCYIQMAAMPIFHTCSGLLKQRMYPRLG